VIKKVRQRTGGFSNLDRPAKGMPGKNSRFSAVDLQEAHQALREKKAHFERVPKGITGPV